MFEYWKARRALRNRIADLDKKQEAASLKLKDMRPDEISLHGLAVGQYQSIRHHFEMELEVLEAKYLMDKAARWGIEGTAPTELYNPNMTGVEPRRYFREPNKTKMRKMISDARRKRLNEWSPVISLLISFIALLFSIFAFFRP